MNHPCQTDRDINLQIVPEDQITGLRVLSLRWKLLKRIVFIEVIRCKDNIAILRIILGHFFFIAKKLELSGEMRVIPTFLFYGTLTMGAAWFFEWKNGIPIVQLQGYRSGNQNGRKNADIGQPWGLFFSQYQAYHTLNEYLAAYPSRRIAKCFRWSVHAAHARAAFCRTTAGSAADDGTHGR